MRHVILVSGKDSFAAAVVQKAKAPDLDYEYIFNPTGAELPPVNEWLSRVEAYLGCPIVRVGENLTNIIHDKDYLPSHGQRFCTKEAKIRPLERYLGRSEPVTVYYGLRYDELERSGYTPTPGSVIVPEYPLREARMTLPMVWGMVDKMGLMPPLFLWQEMVDKVKFKIGKSTMMDDLLPWETQVLFSWRSRPNCYYCFFQRQYEFIGLHDHFPDLFWEAVEMEESTGGGGFTINRNYSLRQLLDRRRAIFNKRAKQIIRILRDRANRPMVPFGDGESVGTLEITSCGLYCGK